jgi:uncharacterized protein YeeX (DUF496 family)
MSDYLDEALEMEDYKRTDPSIVKTTLTEDVKRNIANLGDLVESGKELGLYIQPNYSIEEVKKFCAAILEGYTQSSKAKDYEDSILESANQALNNMTSK